MTLSELEKADIRRVADMPCHWERLKDKTVVISGGTGFIGSFLTEVFRVRNEVYHDRIHVISLSRHGGEQDETVTQVKADITRDISLDGPVDFILHLASNTHPEQYAADPVGTITTNILGCQNLLKLAAAKGSERFLLASSVEIYGQGVPHPVDESYGGYIDCCTARAGYNEAKRTCEALCKSYEAQYGTDVVIVRLARTFGADHKKDTKAMAQFIDKAVRGENIVLKSEGRQRYSYSYVADSAAGLLKVFLDGRSGEAYNVAEDDEEKTLGDYAAYLANLAGTKVVFDIKDNPAASRASYALISTTKLKNLGWKPLYSVSEGLKQTLQIYRERERVDRNRLSE